MPDMWMDVDAALSEVPVNIAALIDDTDFKTRETGIVYNQAGMDLVWNFVTTAGAYTQTAVTPTTAGDYDWSHQGDGMYSIEIPASGGASINNDTEGFGWFTGICTGVLPWRGPTIGFRAAATNNSLVDGTTIDVNATAISGDTTAADNLELDYDGTGYNKSASTIGTCTTNTDMRGTDSAALAATALTNVTWTNARAGYLDNINGHTAQTGDNYPRLGAPAGASVSVDIAAVKTDTGNIETDTQDIQSRVPAALVGGRIDSNVGAISADSTAADNLEADYDGTGYNKSASTIGTCTTNTDMRGTDSALLAASAPANFGDLSITLTTGRVDVASIEGSDATNQIRDSVVDDATRIDASALNTLSGNDPGSQLASQADITALNDPTAASVADAVWDEAKAGHVGVGSFGEEVQSHSLSSEISALNDLSAAQVNSEVDTALTDIHLDHLLAVDYNPASKPGVITALLNELVEDDGGVSRFTANALEQAPGGGGGDATAANQTTIINHLTSIKDNNAGADFDSSTDSLEAIRNRGDAAWVTGGGVGGSSTINITVQDQASAAIQDCSVEIWNTNLDSIISFVDSNANGLAQLTANDGTYKVKMRKSGFSFSIEDLTVSGTTAVSYTGTSLQPNAPSSADLCRVYDYFVDAEGNYPSDIKGTVRVQDDSGVSELFVSMDLTDRTSYDSSTGTLYFDLVRLTICEILIPSFNVRKVITVPDQTTAQLRDL